MLSDWVDGGVVCPKSQLLHLRLVRHSWSLGPPVLGAGVHAPPPLGELCVEHQPALGSPGTHSGHSKALDFCVLSYLCSQTSSMLIVSIFNVPVTFKTMSLQLENILVVYKYNNKGHTKSVRPYIFWKVNESGLPPFTNKS